MDAMNRFQGQDGTNRYRSYPFFHVLGTVHRCHLLGKHHWELDQYLKDGVATGSLPMPNTCPPPGVESPLRWGTEEGLDVLLGLGVRSIESERRMERQYYQSIEHAVEVFKTYFGPTIQALEKIGPEEQDRLLDDLYDVMSR